jgi:hypothetical protein
VLWTAEGLLVTMSKGGVTASVLRLSAALFCFS